MWYLKHHIRRATILSEYSIDLFIGSMGSNTEEDGYTRDKYLEPKIYIVYIGNG
jgi:hypothetical protein